jgi:NAD+ kinase
VTSAQSLAVILFYNQRAQESGLLRKVEAFLAEHHFATDAFAIESCFTMTNVTNQVYRFALALGGDGTMLRASLLVQPLQIPLMAVDAGRVGFLARHTLASWQGDLEAFLQGQLPLEERMLLQVQAFADGQPKAQYLAVNEVLIASVNRKLLDLRFCVDGATWLTVRAEGLVVATPTGSTGYALSQGAAIVEPRANVLLLHVVAPYGLTLPPLIVGANALVSVEVATQAGVGLWHDGQLDDLEADTHWSFRLAQSGEKVLWMSSSEHSGLAFYSTLQQKMSCYRHVAGAKECYKNYE